MPNELLLSVTNPALPDESAWRVSVKELPMLYVLPSAVSVRLLPDALTVSDDPDVNRFPLAEYGPDIFSTAELIVPSEFNFTLTMPSVAAFASGAGNIIKIKSADKSSAIIRLYNLNLHEKILYYYILQYY